MGWWAKIMGGGKRKSADRDGLLRKAKSLQNGSPEYHRFVAQQELQRGEDLPRGARHLARLLSAAAADIESLQLAEQYFQADSDNPMELLPESQAGDTCFEEEALRAWLLARGGRLQEAVELLVALVNAKQDACYLEAWVLDWLEVPGAAESLPGPTMLKLMLLVSQQYPEWRFVTADQQRFLDRYVNVMRRWNVTEDQAEVAKMTQIELLRKAGRFPEALRTAEQFVRDHPGWHAHMSEALVRREMGQVDAATAAFQRAIDCRPDELAARLEVADMFFDREQWDEACRWYQQVLEKHPDHPWALPSWLYGQWRQTSDQQHLDRIWTMLEQDSTSRRAYELYERYTPYLGFLPEPEGPTSEFIRQILPQMDGSEPLEQQEGVTNAEFVLPLEHLDPPSSRLAFRMMAETYRRKARLLVNVRTIPSPDPRKPCRPVKYLLWTYHETEPAPAAPVPYPTIAQHVRELASQPYDFRANWASTSRIAARLEATDAASVLAVMVHPPPLPAGENVLDWLPRVQVAAALLLAQLDGDWHTSLRRDALLSALWGAVDWTTSAAIIALTQLARHDQSTAADIREAFAILAEHRPCVGAYCYEHALFSNWILLPGISNKERRSLEKKLKRLEKKQKPKN
jgi:tetratricopeptide (TPR) repeat protein